MRIKIHEAIYEAHLIIKDTPALGFGRHIRYVLHFLVGVLGWVGLDCSVTFQFNALERLADTRILHL